MRILFINPPNLSSISSVLPGALEEKRGCNPPLGLLYIAGFLQAGGNDEIKVIDGPTENLSLEHLKEIIKGFNPEVIGMSAMSFTVVSALRVAKTAKEINPRVRIVMGGPHVHLFGKETLALGGCDYVVLGEGEKTFYELIRNIDDEEKLKGIPGLIFYDKNKQLIRTGLPQLIENLDELPFPARNLIDNNKYFSVLGTSNLVTTMITSRGCPYRCLFCDRPQLGKIFRARSPKNVVDEMEECLKNFGIKEFLIYDDTFTVDRQRVIDICQEIQKRNMKIVWDIRARVNTVDEELLVLLKKAGCERIHFGVESGTQKILDILRKGITLEQVEKAFKMAKKAGIQTLAYFMIGNPTETKEDVLATIKFAKKINPDYAHITVTMPFPGTDLYFMALAQGIIKKDVWLEFAKNPTSDFTPPVWQENLKREELQALIKKAYQGFYFRPAYLLKRILSLRSFGELKRKAKAGLSVLKIK